MLIVYFVNIFLDGKGENRLYGRVKLKGTLWPKLE